MDMGVSKGLTVPTESGDVALKVLVVDDTATNRLMLQVFLKKLGLGVVLAEDGEQGVAAFAREAPDIVIMDVMMPVMDGYEATRRIKAMAGDHWVPVIFLSALDKEEDLVAGLDAGGDDYLMKPVNFVVLDAKLHSTARALSVQRSLEYERQRTQAISDNLVDGVVVIDAKGTMQFCNPAVEAIFGYTQQELIGQNVSMLMPAEERREHDGHIQRYLKGGLPRVIGTGQNSFTGLRKSGERFPLEVGLSEMRVSGGRSFVGVLHDASARVAAERMLRENAARLQEYHDRQEETAALAATILSRQMQREGLDDPAVRYWLAAAENFSGDIVAATRGPDGALYGMLADATGHGLAAAICTIPVLSVFYGMGETGAPLDRIVHEVDRQLQATLPVGHFVAAALLRISADCREVDVWVGGTPEVLLVGADGRLRQRIASSGLPLGIDAGMRDGVVRLDAGLEPGDQIVLCSDGLVEAENAAGERFGAAGLLAALAAGVPEERLESVRNALAAHLGTVAAHDDVSLLIVTGAPPP